MLAVHRFIEISLLLGFSTSEKTASLTCVWLQNRSLFRCTYKNRENRPALRVNNSTQHLYVPFFLSQTHRSKYAVTRTIELLLFWSRATRHFSNYKKRILARVRGG